MTEEAVALQDYLDAQRAGALAILDGLTDEQLGTTPVVPSGWTPIGLIKHLGHAERYWFQTVFHATAADVTWPEDDEQVMTSAHPVAEVFAFYREQCERGNALLATTSLDAKPAERHGGTRTTRSPIYAGSCFICWKRLPDISATSTPRASFSTAAPASPRAQDEAQGSHQPRLVEPSRETDLLVW